MFCSACRRQTSPTAGTILHNSRVPLRSWFLAMWLACTQKTGLSAKGCSVNSVWAAIRRPG